MLNLAQLRERRENGEKGFTLIELLVVVVIIGILVAIAIPVYLNYTKGAADKAAESDLRGAISVLEQCDANNGSYPAGPLWWQTDQAACTGQRVNVSADSNVFYLPVQPATGPASYMLFAWNAKGTNSSNPFDDMTKSVYCYSGVKGGAIKYVVASAAENAYYNHDYNCPSR